MSSTFSGKQTIFKIADYDKTNKQRLKLFMRLFYVVLCCSVSFSSSSGFITEISVNNKSLPSLWHSSIQL